LDPHNGANIDCELRGFKASAISGEILTSSEMNTHNTFDNPEAIKPTEFKGATITEKGFSADIPPMSVVVLNIK